MTSAIPEPLWLVESFLNSVDVESGQDDLDSRERFARWLADHGRREAAGAVTDDDLALARELRALLRHALAGHTHRPAGGQSDPTDLTDPAALDTLAARAPLRVRFTTVGDVALAPASGGVAGVLGEVLGAVAAAALLGTWQRLKLCRNGGCQVVFYDRSKNGSRCWCSMRVCGNRSKTRTYRRRRGDGS